MYRRNSHFEKLVQFVQRQSLRSVHLAANVPGLDGLWVACENSPSNQVFAASHEVIDSVAADLAIRNIRCTKLHVSHAFHSEMVSPAAEAIRSFADYNEGSNGYRDQIYWLRTQLDDGKARTEDFNKTESAGRARLRARGSP